jgi:hypothetical protein
MQKEVIIVVICHSNGQFSVGKNLGTGLGGRVFKTREAADAYAKQVAKEALPAKAKIIIHDLEKGGSRDV